MPSAPTDSGDISIPTNINGADVNKGDVINTNVQVEGIDEADICKCDGKYFYLLSTGKNMLIVYDLKGNVIASTKLRVSEYETKLYIYKNKIVVNNFFTEIYSLDGNTLSLEKTISNYSFETRLVSGIYYSISKESIKKIKDIDYGCYYDGYSEANYIYTITSYNLDTKEEKSVKIIEGSDCNLYMSDNNIYLASTTYIYNEAGERYMYIGIRLTSVSIFNYSLEAKGTIKLYGKVRNQFSMDEYNGYFRIVSTNNTYSSEKINSLFVYSLNDLKLVGSLENEIGEDYQEIKSVTFNGDTCYCVTYRNTDPLYEIDLSDPTKPVITSVLRTPGYSGYMYKFMINDKLYILGLGYSDSRLPKISVYDATNGENTQVGKTFDFKYNHEFYEHENGYPIDYYDEIDWLNHKSLLLYNDGGYLYLGKKITNDTYVIFKIDVNDNEVISVYKEIKNTYTDTENRGFLIDGVIYVVDGSGIYTEALK